MCFRILNNGNDVQSHSERRTHHGFDRPYKLLAKSSSRHCSKLHTPKKPPTLRAGGFLPVQRTRSCHFQPVDETEVERRPERPKQDKVDCKKLPEKRLARVERCNGTIHVNVYLNT
jgi:hypothetical protein